MEADVLVELKAKQVDHTFTYHIPDTLIESVQKGVRVTVPFSHQKLEGFVLEVHKDQLGSQAKDLISVIDDQPVLNEEMLELGKYISKKTFSTLISAYQTMLPKALKAHHDVSVSKKYVSVIQINKEADLKGKQKELYEVIQKKGSVFKKEASLISSYALKVLLEKEILKEEKQEVYRLQEESILEEKKVTLTSKQQEIVDTVCKRIHQFQPYLLHGVTGSGKTEVYMHIMEQVLKQGKEAIVLVPEISLTPQMVRHFKQRFGTSVAILHSRLSDGEKYDEWRKIEKKEVQIAIGARSAIFAPFTNLGVIIIDEEHSSTYKQENNPRYHAIDIAIKRAKTHKCPILLGSATPSIESYTRAKSNIYTLLELKERIHQKMPSVKIVDMQKEMKQGNRILSSVLKEKIESCLEKKEQVILLLNRRGYTTIVTCKSCGYVDKCPNCEIPLTYHKDSNTMRCHYCGYGSRKLTECPSCHRKEINEYGMGTQRLEELIKNTFDAKVVRMDMDTTSKKGAHEKITTAFENGEYDILLGTQMIAKGLDFPNVTLVGVLNADATLQIPDFRSSERTFELLNQVAGRAGRSEKEGEVIFQCFNVDHYSILCAANHDYKSFYEEEMRIRKKLQYPPFTNLALIRIHGKNIEEIIESSNKIASYLKRNCKEATILGPSPSNLAKKNQHYYYQVIVKYKNTKDVYEHFWFIRNRYQKDSHISVEIECNPLKF